jgi:hypothetical protein
MRTFGKTSMRGAGATVFLALLGLAAALVPLALYSVASGGEQPGMLFYFAASMIAGGVVGRALRRQ